MLVLAGCVGTGGCGGNGAAGGAARATPDAASPDTGSQDADTASPDAVSPDASSPDADATAPDAASADAGSPDAASADAASADAAPACPAGQLLCGAQCVDTTHANYDCGACGSPCVNGQVCVQSSCMAVPTICGAGYHPDAAGGVTITGMTVDPFVVVRGSAFTAEAFASFDHTPASVTGYGSFVRADGTVVGTSNPKWNANGYFLVSGYTTPQWAVGIYRFEFTVCSDEGFDSGTTYFRIVSS